MKVKHSKYKNTGILFELLTRQLTADTIAGSKPKSLSIIQKYFSGNSALLKEYKIYQTFISKKFKEDANATLETALNYIDDAVDSAQRLEDDYIPQAQDILNY